MAWARRRRRVRLYLDREPSTLEGYLIGRVNGSYHLALPRVLEAEGRSHALEGDVMVPRDRVVFYSVLGEPAE